MAYQVLNCDNTVDCDTLEEACRVAGEWFPENWHPRLNPAGGLGEINRGLRDAYGQGECPDAACPEIREADGDGW